MSSSEDIQREAKALAEYLLGESATERSIALYTEALSAHPIPFQKSETRLWKLAMSYPFLLSFIDAGLVFHQRHSAVRKRIFLFFCVAETIPEWSHHFLPQNQEKIKTIFSLLVILFLSSINIVLGFLLVSLVLRD